MFTTQADLVQFILSCRGLADSQHYDLEFKHSKQDVEDAASLVMKRFEKLRVNRKRTHELVSQILKSYSPIKSASFSRSEAIIDSFLQEMDNPENKTLKPSFEIAVPVSDGAIDSLDENKDLIGLTVIDPDQTTRIMIRCDLGLERTLLAIAFCLSDCVLYLWNYLGCPKTNDSSVTYVAKLIVGSETAQQIHSIFNIVNPKTTELEINDIRYVVIPRTAVELKLFTYFVT